MRFDDMSKPTRNQLSIVFYYFARPGSLSNSFFSLTTKFVKLYFFFLIKSYLHHISPAIPIFSDINFYWLDRYYQEVDIIGIP